MRTLLHNETILSESVRNRGMRTMKLAHYILLGCCLHARVVNAQVVERRECGSPITAIAESYASDIRRVSEITGTTSIQPQAIRNSSSISCSNTTKGTALGTGARLLTVFNSAYPVDRNNGPVWGGRGLSFGLEAGAWVRSGVFSAGFIPELTFEENRAFQLADTSEALGGDYHYPWIPIDF